MSLYHIVFLFLLICTIIEFKKGNTPRHLFYIAFGVLTLMLCLRYLQGTDYESYELIYSKITTNLIASLSDPNVHGEPGWKILCWTFRLFSVPFPVFVFLFSALQMYLFWRFVNQFCQRKQLALFLSYHTLYLTFFFSTMRQGMVVAVFLGLLLELFLKKKYWQYYLISILLSTIHSCGLMLLVLPILNTKLFATTWRCVFWVAAAWTVGILISTGILDGILMKVLPSSVLYYIEARGVSLVAALERLASYSVSVIAILIAEKKIALPNHVRFALKVISLGMIIYGGFVWLPVVASRLSYLFKVVEIVILTSLLIDKDLFSNLKILFCVMLVGVMYVKNISVYILEGRYYDHINILNYPYISIFDGEDARKDKPPRFPKPIKDTGVPAATPYNPSYDYLTM